MTFWQHIKALLGVVFISGNLILVLLPLLVLLLISPLQSVWPSLTAHLHHATYLLYRHAVTVNDWWFHKVIGVEWNVTAPPAAQPPPTSLRNDRSYLVISNHQSWFDIYIVQSLIVRNGPMMKFLVKRELAYVPIVGWVILALRFPLLQRRSTKNRSAASEHDLNAIEKACVTVADYPTALMNFVEGTRFSQLKRQQSQSPYQNLLKPRRTGLRSMLNALEQKVDAIVDIGIRYPGSSSFWQCMGGVHKRIDCSMEMLPCPAQSELDDWLDSRWQAKDLFLEQHRI